MQSLNRCALSCALLAIGFLSPSLFQQSQLPGVEVSANELAGQWGMGCTKEVAGNDSFCDSRCGLINQPFKLATSGDARAESKICADKSCFEVQIDATKGCTGG